MGLVTITSLVFVFNGSGLDMVILILFIGIIVGVSNKRALMLRSSL